MEKDFIVTQVSWHTQKVRNYEFDNSIIYKYFKGIIEYLQNNGLTTRTILPSSSPVTEETCIKSSDLTDEGMLLIKKAYSKWVDNVVDKGKSPTDYKLLEKTLNLIRQSRA